MQISVNHKISKEFVISRSYLQILHKTCVMYLALSTVHWIYAKKKDCKL